MRPMRPPRQVPPPSPSPSPSVLDDLVVVQRIPIYFLDLLFVVILYFSAAFWLAVLIDGIILPNFDAAKAALTPSWLLYLQVLIQISVQIFIVIVLSVILQAIPSPVNGILGYNTRGTLASVVIRNPAIMTVILFFLSKSLQGRLTTLFARFDRNALA